MDAIIAAIITGVFTAIVAPIVTIFAKRYLDDRNLDSPSAAVDGIWEGIVIQDDGPAGTRTELRVRMRLKRHRKRVKGEVTISDDDINRVVECDVAGGFFHSRYLKLEYVTRDKAAVQFGSVLLHLSPDGTSMKGRFVGYGPISQKIITGSTNYIKARY